MEEAKHTPSLRVHLDMEEREGNQYSIHNEHCWSSLEGEWRDKYVRFGGYFGSYGPHMFAAAPELLAALQEFVDDIADRFDMDSPSTNPGIKHCVKQARAAIKRATGQ